MTPELVSELRKLPVLPAAELLSLIAAAKAGDRKARDKVVRHNMRYVLRQVQRQHRPELFDELMQAGAIGINHAIDKFDASRGYKFITYASAWVRERINRERDKHDSGGLWATKSAHSQGVRMCSLDAAAHEHGGLDGLTTALKGEQADIVMKAICTLSARERRIILAKYYEDQSLAAVGVELGLSRERVRQIEAIALEKMKEALEAARASEG